MPSDDRFTRIERRWWNRLLKTIYQCPETIRLVCAEDGGVSAFRKRDGDDREPWLDTDEHAPIRGGVGPSGEESAS